MPCSIRFFKNRHKINSAMKKLECYGRCRNEKNDGGKGGGIIEMKGIIKKLINTILSTDVKCYFILVFIIQLIPSLILSSFNIDNTNRSVQIIEQSNNNLINFFLWS